MGLGVGVGAAVGLALGAVDGNTARPALHGAVVGFLAGLQVGLTEEYLVPGLARRLEFVALNAFRIGVYALGLSAAVLAGNALPRMVLEGLGPGEALRAYVAVGHPARDAGIGMAAALVATFLLQLRRLHNREELWRLLSGRFHSPRSERRVFLFVDLADSSGAAEALDPTVYSAFLRDVFRDMSEPILAWRGLVYQHVGDAVVVSWPFPRGVADGACVRCFFDIQEALATHAPRFQGRYGRVPRVRGAVHGGPVVTTWVGEAKRELAFHGDTVNTVARLQGLASSLDRPLLVSDALRGLLVLPGFRSERLGAFDLRGRRHPLEVHAVEPAARNPLAPLPVRPDNPDDPRPLDPLASSPP